MLEVRDLSVWYGRRQVLHDLCLGLGPRECLAVIGPNGAGKTSLARALAGIGGRTRGQVSLDGKQLSGLRGDQVVADGLALVPERGGLFAEMTVRENLLVTQEFAGAADDSVLADCFRLFPVLEERAGQRAGTLSGGERRMLVISKALLTRPRVIVMDEPSLGLSPRLTTEVILRLIPQLLERDVSVLLIEQNARLALRAADRGMVLDRGAVVAEGSSGELLGSRSLSEAYIGV